MATPMYLYAVIPSRTLASYDVAGLDENDDTVYTLPEGDLAAVVSASPLADYRGLDRVRAARYLVAHQRVVEAVMSTTGRAEGASSAQPLLPVRFGTTLPDETWVSRMLSQGAGLFGNRLAQLGGLVQLEVVVLWNLQQVIQEIALEPAIAQCRSDLSERAAGGQGVAPTVAERTALGQMVDAALAARRAALSERLLPELCAGAREHVHSPLMDATMVVNVALLLDCAARKALEQRVEALDHELGGRYTFRCVGPLPPYSFATVEVVRPALKAIDAARSSLGLGDRATLAEVRRAYHMAASQAHPDHAAAGVDSADRMTCLAQAYQTLCAYALGEMQGADGQQASADRVGLDMTPQAVEHRLLICVRRQPDASGALAQA